jgi:hypothetical protein
MDAGMSNMVLVGYSMGGLLSRLQVSSSGGAVWNLASARGLETLRTSESTREFLREILYFEPVPTVSRVIFIATPHEGSGVARSLLGRFGSSLVQLPEDSRARIEQLDRDNPGALRPLIRDLPTSVDMLAPGNPLLETIRGLPIREGVRTHSIVGHGFLPPECARGDGVVPVESAHLEGTESEVWVRARHTNIYHQPDTIREVARILEEHALGLGIGG